MSLSERQGDSDVTRSPADQGDAEDPRLFAAVQEYLAAVDSGKRVNRQEFIARHPDIADELSACLQGLAFVNSAAAQMKGDAASSGNTGGGEEEIIDGRPLGDFKLIREIGRGGMGVVYEATQLSLGRRVAVKVLSFAAALDPRHLQRFHNEAQAAAQLHHTNIVPVYAVGCERSVHYYAMQLIEGQSLSEVIRELRRAAGRDVKGQDVSGNSPKQDDEDSFHPSTRQRLLMRTPMNSENLGPRTARERIDLTTHPGQNMSVVRAAKRTSYYDAVARLALQAAEALEYAHNLGVVHRDIKPANLLLDNRGNLWITDFGLAQFYADSGLTQTGDVLGTFRYMSPEQASGRAVVLDQRTDIYSLGVTLYELLTLERALPGTTREQLLHQIGSVDPKPPRSIDKNIPIELETIITKSVSKEPSDRYPTARALADDLQRFLRDEPILARPPSLWDKTVKWTRRHRAVTVSAMIVLVMATAGLLISTVLIAQAQRKTADAYNLQKQKTIEANQQRELAEKSFKEARSVVDFYTRIAAEEMANKPQFGDLRKTMLEASLVYYQKFLDDRKNDPSIVPELTAARSHVANILAELSEVDDYFRTWFRARLVLQGPIQDELHLSPEQRSIVEHTDFSDPGNTLHRLEDLPTDVKQTMLTKSTADLENTLKNILKPEQFVRLRQLFWQGCRDMAFNDPAVVESLSLTRQQTEKIRSIQSEARDQMGRLGRGGPPEQRQQMQQKRQDIQEQTMRNVLDQLTDNQLEIWNAMIGEPFDGPINLFPHGPGPGPDRGGPGPGSGPDRNGQRHHHD